MRLWHEELLPKLPRNQILGQHRECCALRGGSWGKKHSVVDYVFTHSMEALFVYHTRVMKEMEKRNFKVAEEWMHPNYRGKNCEEYKADMNLIHEYERKKIVYSEHNEKYLKECIENLKGKGIIIE